MALNFPANPDTGDTYVVGNATWRFNGLAWDQLAAVPQATVQKHEAGTNLSGHRAIRVSSGIAYLCDGSNAAHVGRAIGISTGAATSGADVTVQTSGLLTEPSWSWTDGPVLVGASGVLTQSRTGLTYIHQIGIAVSATQIDINPLSPILIS